MSSSHTGWVPPFRGPPSMLLMDATLRHVVQSWYHRYHVPLPYHTAVNHEMVRIRIGRVQADPSASESMQVTSLQSTFQSLPVQTPDEIVHLPARAVTRLRLNGLTEVGLGPYDTRVTLFSG